jgi:hypothetical protein
MLFKYAADHPDEDCTQENQSSNTQGYLENMYGVFSFIDVKTRAVFGRTSK